MKHKLTMLLLGGLTLIIWFFIITYLSSLDVKAVNVTASVVENDCHRAIKVMKLQCGQ